MRADYPSTALRRWRPLLAVLAWLLPPGPDVRAAEADFHAGQDFTRPLRRLDLRWTYSDLPDGLRSHTFTFRTDQPWQLSDRWKLNTRLDLPIVYNDVPASDNLKGRWRAGLGDLLAQAVLIRDLDARFSTGAGVRLVFPTATEAQFGAEKYLMQTGGGFRANLGEISEGSFFAPAVYYYFYLGGDSSGSHTSQLRLNPAFNIGLPHGQFLSFLDGNDIRYSFHSGKWFVPFDVTYGKVWDRRFLVSVEVLYPIVDDLDLYQLKTELRLGWFF